MTGPGIRGRLLATTPLLGAAVLGALVGMLVGDPVPGVTFGIGLFVGGMLSVLVVPALRGASIGLTGAAVEDSAMGWAEFHREFSRSRRFDQEFALIRFVVDPAAPGGPLAVRDTIAGIARRIDRVWEDDGSILVLLPVSKRAAAEAFLARVRQGPSHVAALTPTVALFPEHGITTGALISAIYGDSQADVPVPLGALRPVDGLSGVAEAERATHRG